MYIRIDGRDGVLPKEVLSNCLIISCLWVEQIMMGNITPQVDGKIRKVMIQLIPKYDKNGNNKLAVPELAGFLNQAMQTLGWPSKVKQEDAQRTVTLFDKNWDGELSYEEIYSTLRHIVSRELAGQSYFEHISPEQLAALRQPTPEQKSNRRREEYAKAKETNVQKVQQVQIPNRNSLEGATEPTILDDLPEDSTSKQSLLPSILRVSQPQLQVTEPTAEVAKDRSMRLIESKYVWRAEDVDEQPAAEPEPVDILGSRVSYTYTEVQPSITSSVMVESLIPGPPLPGKELASKMQQLNLNEQSTTAHSPAKPKVESPWVKSVDITGWDGVQINTLQDLKLKQLVDDLFNRYDKDFSGTLEVQQLVPAFLSIGHQMNIPQQLHHTKASQLMKMFDRTGDGLIQRHEMYNCLRSLLKR